MKLFLIKMYVMTIFGQGLHCFKFNIFKIRLFYLSLAWSIASELFFVILICKNWPNLSSPFSGCFSMGNNFKYFSTFCSSPLLAASANSLSTSSESCSRALSRVSREAFIDNRSSETLSRSRFSSRQRYLCICPAALFPTDYFLH